jgi:hypothetical protein
LGVQADAILCSKEDSIVLKSNIIILPSKCGADSRVKRPDSSSVTWRAARFGQFGETVSTGLAHALARLSRSMRGTNDTKEVTT